MGRDVGGRRTDGRWTIRVDGTFHVHRLRAGRGVGRLDGSLLGCLRKDVALCHTASWAWVGRTWGDEGRTGDGPFGWTAHFMCTVCVPVVGSVAWTEVC
ncbi:hypothetical protein E4K68_10090 [Desulfosporosinus sp. Sb-LF]|nr:hypothetical protein E4K68_10090 [Desulfosporosinus sp. Sb-LF]